MEVDLTIGARTLATRAPRAAVPAGAAVLFAVAFLLGAFSAGPAWCLWQTFGLADGLAAIQVRSIAQDPSEAMWFATAHGASRYDGASFRTFTPADGLVHEDVRVILPDRSGRVWFGTQGGVSRYDGTSWTSYTTGGGPSSNDVRDILQDRTGALWFATGFGADRFDGTTWTAYHQTDGLGSNLVTCLFEDHAGNLWFGTEDHGVSRFDGTTWTIYRQADGLANDFVQCILETHDHVLWFGTRFGGLSRFDGATWTQILTAGTLTISDVRGLREDRFGRLWVAATTGLARFDGQVWRAYTTADGLVGNLTGLTIDSSGNVWAASDNGVSRYDGESWTSYTEGALGLNATQAVLVDRAGDVWVGTAGGGAAHYDRSAWTSITSSPGGLASNSVAALAQDSTGALWFGTTAGASRFDGTSWRTYTSADGMAGDNVTAIARDSSGALWLGTTAGLSRFDGATWTSYTSANRLPADLVRCLFVDRGGGVWCGTSGGVTRLQDTTWTRYSTADGLASNNVYAILQSRTGTMWFGTAAGLSRFDDPIWQTFNGPGANRVLSLAETPDSVLWVGTFGGGVNRFDGDLWHNYTNVDGLLDLTVRAAAVERSGSIWFGTDTGEDLYDPARVPPQTVITVPPPVLSANRLQTVHFAAAYHQVLGIEFSTSLDSAPWSAWSPVDAWVGRDLPDGVHTFRVSARDLLHHVDPTPATSTFEIAAKPPIPIINAPLQHQAVRDTMVVDGVADALRFRSFRVDIRPAGTISWDPPVATLIAQSQVPVTNGVLARLATKSLPDGNYELQVSVQDTLGLTGYTQVAFIIDNVPPWADQTTPATVSALSGGDVYTTNREAHVYIPPRGLSSDARVHIDPLDPSTVPATLPDGATLVAPGFAIGLFDPADENNVIPLAKAAILDLTVAGDVASSGTRLAVYVAGPDTVWRRLGGTTDVQDARITTPISAAGRFAIFAAPAGASVPGVLLAPSITPRVLSTRAGSMNPTIRIGFTLERPGTARVTVHNRAGRLVRVVMSGESLGAGTNVVSWDGRDQDRHDVEAGLYFVTVEALGQTRTQTLAVVR